MAVLLLFKRTKVLKKKFYYYFNGIEFFIIIVVERLKNYWLAAGSYKQILRLEFDAIADRK